ncbi:MAG: hypothetical protein ACREYE_17505 [Gammaproteobacteria bacterium]
MSAFARIEVLLEGRTAGGRGDARCMGRPTEMLKYALNGTQLGDEGDDPHRLATSSAEEREDFIEAGEQHGPEVAGMGRGLGVERIARFCRRLEKPWAETQPRLPDYATLI